MDTTDKCTLQKGRTGMKTRNQECIWFEAKMKKESLRILYITMDVFVVLL